MLSVTHQQPSLFGPRCQINGGDSEVRYLTCASVLLPCLHVAGGAAAVEAREDWDGAAKQAGIVVLGTDDKTERSETKTQTSIYKHHQWCCWRKRLLLCWGDQTGLTLNAKWKYVYLKVKLRTGKLFPSNYSKLLTNHKECFKWPMSHLDYISNFQFWRNSNNLQVNKNILFSSLFTASIIRISFLMEDRLLRFLIKLINNNK